MFQELPYCGSSPAPGELLARFNFDPQAHHCSFAHLRMAIDGHTQKGRWPDCGLCSQRMAGCSGPCCYRRSAHYRLPVLGADRAGHDSDLGGSAADRDGLARVHASSRAWSLWMSATASLSRCGSGTCPFCTRPHSRRCGVLGHAHHAVRNQSPLVEKFASSFAASNRTSACCRPTHLRATWACSVPQLAVAGPTAVSLASPYH